MNSPKRSLVPLALAFALGVMGCQSTPATVPDGEGALPFATLRLTFDT
jgi:hypothetical protein